jgi:hypothetical protein
MLLGLVGVDILGFCLKMEVSEYVCVGEWGRK